MRSQFKNSGFTKRTPVPGRPTANSNLGELDSKDSSSRVQRSNPIRRPQRFMASHDLEVKVSDRYNDKLPDVVSADNNTSEVAGKNEDYRIARRLRNHTRARLRRNLEARQNRVARNLDAQFTNAAEVSFRTHIANLATAAALLSTIQNPEVRYALRLTQRAWLHLDTQNPAT